MTKLALTNRKNKITSILQILQAQGEKMTPNKGVIGNGFDARSIDAFSI